MSDAFLSFDDFDEQAHQLYNEGRYDDALIVLKEGIALYPHAVELHIEGHTRISRARNSPGHGEASSTRSVWIPTTRTAWPASARRCSRWATARPP